MLMEMLFGQELLAELDLLAKLVMPFVKLQMGDILLPEKLLASVLDILISI
jgi:hypothetical protein